MRYFFILISCFFNFAIASVTGQSDSGTNHFSLSCDQNNDCVVTATNDVTHQQVTFKQHGLAIINKTNFNWYGNNLLELRTGFGSGLAYSNFISFDPLQLSPQFFNTSFVSPSGKIAIVQDEKSSYQYSMVCLFNKKVPAEVILNDGALDFGSYKAIENNQVKFGYYDENGNYKYKTVSLDLEC